MVRFTTLLLALFLFSCSGGQKEKGKEPDVEIGIVEHLGEHIPKGLWFLNEDNDTVRIDEIVDKPTIFSFVYFDCPGICSPLMSSVQELIERLDMELGKDYQVLTISFNTQDSPEKAKEKKKNFASKFKDESKKSWMFLTGTQENIASITNAVGFKFKPRGFDFDHPGAIIMVSPHGKITRYFLGYESYNQFDVKLSIIEAQDEIQRPTINKLLKYCFKYDENRKAYKADVTRISATIILVFAIPFLIVLIVRNRRSKIEKTE